MRRVGGAVAQSLIRGFTIVELLIVVVVIAILAAVTVVAYTGIQNSAKVSAIQSSLQQVGKKLETHKLTHSEIYPLESEAESLTGVSFSHYLTDSGREHFCATITDGSLVYSMSSTATGPMEGECITNWSMNPRPVSSTFGWNTYSPQMGATVTHSIEASGGPSSFISSYFRRTNTTLYTASPTGVGAGMVGRVAASPGQEWSHSVYVRSSCVLNHVRSQFSMFDASNVDIGVDYTPFGVPINTWQRISKTSTTIANTASIALVVYFSGPQSCPVGTTFDATGVMLTQGPTLYAYRDGDSPGWFWTGEPYESASVGPGVAE